MPAKVVKLKPQAERARAERVAKREALRVAAIEAWLETEGFGLAKALMGSDRLAGPHLCERARAMQAAALKHNAAIQLSPAEAGAVFTRVVAPRLELFDDEGAVRPKQVAAWAAMLGFDPACLECNLILGATGGDEDASEDGAPEQG